MSDEKQLEKFDPSKLMDGVKDRIKATFVSLIPDEQWETMCKAEMDKFFQPIPLKNYNGSITGYGPSEFEEIVIEMMKEHSKAYIKELLEKPEYKMSNVYKNSPSGQSGEMRVSLSEHLDAMIKEKMPDMLSVMFKDMLAGAFYQFFANMHQKMQNIQH